MAGNGGMFTNPFLQFLGNLGTGLWAQNEQKQSSAAHPLQSLADKMGYKTSGPVKFGQPLFTGNKPNKTMTAGDFTDPMNIASQLAQEGEDTYQAATQDYQRNMGQANSDAALLSQRVQEGKGRIAAVGAGGTKARSTLDTALANARSTQQQLAGTPNQILAQTTSMAALAMKKLQDTENMITEDRKAWVDSSVQQLVAAREGIDQATSQATDVALRAVDEAGGTQYDREAAARMVKFGAFGNMMGVWDKVAADSAQKYAEFLQGTGVTVAQARLGTMSTLAGLAETGISGVNAANQAKLAASNAVSDILKAQAELDVNIPVLEENMDAALRSFEYAGHKDLREFKAALATPVRGYMGGIMQFTLGTLAALNEDSNLISNELFSRETGITNTLASAVVGGLQYGMNAAQFNKQLAFQQSAQKQNFGLGVAGVGTNLATSMVGTGGLQGLFNFGGAGAGAGGGGGSNMNGGV